jgi:hypothetical protein
MKQIKRKLGITYRILKNDGALELGIRSLQFLQKKTRGLKGISSEKHKIHTSAYYDEVLIADPSKPANKQWVGSSKKKLTFNWLMPPPGKGSGGHMTIFRFIEYLEKAGHTCRIYMHNPGKGSTVEAVKAVMGDSFPNVKAEMFWLWPDEQMLPADGLFATSWETAYTVYCSQVNAKKYYFVQDFEPHFYPVGAFSVLAENTYRLGLRGITAGGWLSKRLHENYGMTTDHFWFGSDSKTYHYDGKKIRKEVAFYARPTTERRAFELGILALDIFHKKHPDYTINFIGWDVSEYNIPFPYENLGILDPSELNEVYNRSSASLVMSLTNMSLLPLELLASGCLPVVNKGENNTLVSDNPYIEYSENDPISLANTISRAIKKNTPTHAKKISKSTQGASWDESGAHFVSVVESSIKLAGNQ